MIHCSTLGSSSVGGETLYGFLFVFWSLYGFLFGLLTSLFPSPGSSSATGPIMVAIKDLKLPEGDKDAIIMLNKEVVKLQTKITLHIKDGDQFPALVEINRLKNLEDPTGSGVYKGLARSQALVKLDEVSRLISDMETSCSNLAAEVMMAGDGLNPKETLEAVVNDIKATEAGYVGKARVALVHLAEATEGATAPPPAGARPQKVRYLGILDTRHPLVQEALLMNSYAYFLSFLIQIQ